MIISLKKYELSGRKIIDFILQCIISILISVVFFLQCIISLLIFLRYQLFQKHMYTDTLKTHTPLKTKVTFQTRLIAQRIGNGQKLHKRSFMYTYHRHNKHITHKPVAWRGLTISIFKNHDLQYVIISFFIE